MNAGEGNIVEDLFVSRFAALIKYLLFGSPVYLELSFLEDSQRHLFLLLDVYFELIIVLYHLVSSSLQVVQVRTLLLSLTQGVGC